MRTRHVSSVLALAIVAISAGCAGESARSATPERTAPVADPPRAAAVTLASAAEAPPAATNGNGAPDAAAATSEPSVDVQADVRAANAFSTRLYGRVKKAPGNLMISGTSVRSALEIAYLGARGETA